METLQTRLQDEQLARERDRRQLHDMLQQLQLDNHQEHEDRVKVDRDLTVSLAGVQSLEKELEERLVEQGQSLGAAIESLQEAVRPQGNELFKKCSETVEQLRAGLHKEIAARNAKETIIDDGLRDITKRLAGEVQSRDAAMRTVTEAIVADRAEREEAMSRERRLAEDDVLRATQAVRKAREEEEKRLQERIIEVSTAVGKERDLRQESLRMEGQKQIALKEEVARELRALRADMAKVSQQFTKGHEEQATRSREVELFANTVVEKVDAHRTETGSHRQRHEDALRGLEQQSAELHRHVTVKVKDQQDLFMEWRRTVDEEISCINAAFNSDRRSRDASEAQVGTTLKSSVRAETDARENGIAAVARDVASLRAQIEQEVSHREGHHNLHQSNLLNIRNEVVEIQSKHKGDVVTLRDLDQLKESFVTTMRDERRHREKDVMRLETRAAAAPGTVPAILDTHSVGEGLSMQQDLRVIRQAVGETQERVEQIETRQKTAEERTVSMLDAIMSGLANGE